MESQVALGRDIRRLSVTALTLRIDGMATETVANGLRFPDWMGRFRQNYISLEPGGDKTTDGEIGDFGISMWCVTPRFAIWSNEGL